MNRFEFPTRARQIETAPEARRAELLEQRDVQLEDYLLRLEQAQQMQRNELVIRGAGSAVAGVVGGTFTTNSFTPVQIVAAPVLTGSFVKVRADSIIIADLHICYVLSGTPVAQKFYVGLDAVSYTVITTAQNTAGQHVGYSGVRTITGLAAGTYAVSIKCSSDSIAGSINCDVNDTISLHLREVLR